MANKWYVLHVKPHKERSVYNLLLSQEGIRDIHAPDGDGATAVFYPRVRVKPADPRSARIRPFFPGYLFVHADLQTLGLNAFNWIPGVHRLVSFGNKPSIVPDNLINELRNRMVRIEEAGGLVFDGLKPGDPVRIVSGPFAGYEAIFDMRLPGRERVQVLLAFLGRHPRRIKLGDDAIEKIHKPKQHKRKA